MTTDYCGLAALKNALDIPVSDSVDDDVLASAIDAASRQIDAYCGRRFFQDTAVVERTYWPDTSRVVTVDDISTTTGLIVQVDTSDDGTYDTTLTINTDFQLAPVNAAAELPVRPYTQIRLLDGTVSAFSRYASGRAPVQVTAKFGWPAVPDPVERACVFQAKNLFKAPDMIGGVVQVSEFGGVYRQPSMDHHAMRLLEHYVRYEDIADG